MIGRRKSSDLAIEVFRQVLSVKIFMCFGPFFLFFKTIFGQVC